MAKFRVKSPDGAEYEVDAPEGATERDAIAYVARNLHKPSDPYAKKSTEEIAKSYRQAKLLDADESTLRKISDAYVRRENETASTLGQFANGIDYGVRSMAKGVPIVGGLLDEGNAALASLTGTPYSEALDYQRARDRYAEKNAPGLELTGNLVGGVASGLGAARALGLGVGSGVPLARQALVGGAVGAPVGAADFAARAEGDDRGPSAAVGGVLGAVTGAALPFVGAGLSAGAKRLMDILTSDRALSTLGISRSTAQHLLRQLSTDELGGAGAARIREGGPDAMLSDSGPGASNLLDTALERSGPGSTAARGRIERRAADAGQALNRELDQQLGPQVGVEARTAQIRNSTAAQRGHAYRQAEDQPIDFNTPEGQQLAADMERIPQWAIEEARQEIAMRGEQPTLVRVLDRATRALNSAATRGERGGALGGNTPLGNASGNLAQDIRQSLRQAVPEYATALDTAADPIQRVQATKLGQRLLDLNFTRDELAQELHGITAPERQAALGGVRDAIDEMAAKVTQMASDPNTDARELRATLQGLTSRSSREKMQMILGSQDRARALYGQIGRAMRALEMRASVARGSRTYGRQAMDAAVKAQQNQGIIDSLVHLRPSEAAKKIMQRLSGTDPLRQLEEQDRIYGEIADVLTRTRGAQAERFLDQLRRALAAQSNNRGVGRGIGIIGQSAVGGAAPVTESQVLPRR